jgi:hypothetical protein
MTSLVTFVRRYAPFLAVLVTLAALLVAAPSRPLTSSSSFGSQPDGGFGSASPSQGGAAGSPGTPTVAAAQPGAVPGAALVGGSAPRSSGPTGSGAQQPLTCTPRKFNAALPCMPSWSGTNNGGVTSHNVGAKSLVFVWYVIYANETERQLKAEAGTDYTPDQIRADSRALEKYLNQHWQTYGRTIRVVPYFGTHDVTDDAGLKSEAVEIDQQLHAFAVAAGQTPVALATELGRRGVITFNTYQQVNSFYAQNAPYQYSVFGDADLLNGFTAEYVGKRLKGRVAQFAGTGSNTKTRVFGVCYEEVLKASADDLIRRLKAVGVTPVVVSYGSDVSQAQQQSLNIVSQFRAAGVTTVIDIGNVVGPVFLTSNADTQHYYPEYLVNGYSAIDSEEGARLYSPTQWNHAFGFTQITVRNAFQDSQGYGASKLADPSYEPSKNVIAEYLALQQIANGVERSGPDVTPRTFQSGLGSVPATLPGPKQPRLSYGSRGPGPYTGRDDVAEIWWNPSETHTFDGKRGAYERVNSGARVQLGGFPTTVPAVFR